VRDTPFERKQHESTAKHQNNLKRFLRDIQNNHERTERDKERAKAEVDRLNKITGSGTGTASPQPATVSSTSSGPSVRKSASGPLTADDQKRQWSQLAEMGIQVPDSFRAEMAMAGSWQSLPKPTQDQPVEEESLSKGIRKRKLDEEEEEAEEQVSFKSRSRTTWGKTTKQYPGQSTSDLDALLSATLPVKKDKLDATDQEKPDLARQLPQRLSPRLDESDINDDTVNHTGDTERVENVGEGLADTARSATPASEPVVKTESTDAPDETPITTPASMPVFRKRRAKPSSTSA
jgi:hypothetical protein